MNDPEHDVSVIDNPKAHRYEIWFDGAQAGFARYRLEDGVTVFLHTEIDPAFEGHGLGSRLASGALDDVRAHGRSVVALCPFIASYIRHHPQYADLTGK
jgi:predicted GNAT family acetyltransferase